MAVCAHANAAVVVVVVWVCWSSAPLAAVLLTLLLTFAFDPLIVAIRVLARDSPLRRQPNNEIASKALRHLVQAFTGLVLDGGPPEGPVTATNWTTNHSQQFRNRRRSSQSGFGGRNCLTFSSFSPDLALRSLPCRMTSVFVAAPLFLSVDHECACEVHVSAPRCLTSFYTGNEVHIERFVGCGSAGGL